MSPRRTTPREHGTRARYCFGPIGNDRTNGCRCEPCREANRTYARFEQKRTRLNRDHGAWARPLVNPDRALAHMADLRAQGVGYRQIANLAGLPTANVSDMLHGRHKRIRRETETAILAVRPDLADGALIDSAPTWQLIDRLLTNGITKRRIGQAVTGNPDTLALQLRRGGKITARAARRVEALHWEILGDPATPDRPDRRRFPIQAALDLIAQAGLTKIDVITRSRVNLHRATRLGYIAADAADRLAIAIGTHPANIWPDWYGTSEGTAA